MLRELLINKLVEACNRKWTQNEFSQYISYLCQELNDYVRFWHTGYEHNYYETGLMEITYNRDTSAKIVVYGDRTFKLGIDGILQ